MTDTTELVKLSAVQMAEKLRAKEITSRDLVSAQLDVIDAAEPSIKAFLAVSGEAPWSRRTRSTICLTARRPNCPSSPACRSRSRT